MVINRKMTKEEYYADTRRHMSAKTTAEGGASAWQLPAGVYENGVTDAEIYKYYQLLPYTGRIRTRWRSPKSAPGSMILSGPGTNAI